MRRDEAEREAERLGREHPERASYRWFARELGGGVWPLVRVPRAYPRLADELEGKQPLEREENPEVARDTDLRHVGGAS